MGILLQEVLDYCIDTEDKQSNEHRDKAIVEYGKDEVETDKNE